MTTSASTAEAPAPKKKNTWETVLTTTPVLLTMLATLLAGLSSGEMTKAQYYRSLATQNQAKAGDQWSFFQAKRLRGSGLKTSLNTRQPLPDRLDADRLRFGVTRLTSSLKRAAKEASLLAEACKKQASAGSASALQAEAARLHETAETQAGKADESEKAVLALLLPDRLPAAFEFLTTAKLPSVEKWKPSDPALAQVYDAVSNRERDVDLDALAHRVQLRTEQVQSAIAELQETTKQLDNADQEFAKAIDPIIEKVNGHAALAVPLLNALARAREAAEDDGEAGKQMEALTARGQSARQAAEDLAKSLSLARDDYDERRYRAEANTNRQLATVYEIQVHLSSATSDNHRRRSNLFFIGMLAAQAGVAISSLALAARKRSVLWVLASLAGAGALVFSAYVYLSV
jgi:hypothetical protein